MKFAKFQQFQCEVFVKYLHRYCCYIVIAIVFYKRFETLSLLQNSKLLTSSSPDVTNCFQQAVLAWLPCLFLMTFGSTYLVFVRNHISETPNKNGLSLIGWIQTVRLIKMNVYSVNFCTMPYFNNSAM